MKRFSLAVVLPVLSLMGCGSPGPVDVPAPRWAAMSLEKTEVSTGGAVNSALVASPASLERVSRAGKPYKLVLIIGSESDVTSPLVKGFLQKAKELGTQGQVVGSWRPKEIAGNTVEGANAICLTQTDGGDPIFALKTVQHNGIPIIVIADRRDPEKPPAFASDGIVEADGVTGGRLAGQAMILLGNRNQVAALGGPKEDALIRGFASVLNGNLDVAATETVAADPGDARRRMTYLLERYPHLNGIFCADETTAKGALQAISQSGKQRQMMVVGYGTGSFMRSELAAGIVSATVDERLDLMGRYAAEMAVGILSGQIRRGDEVPVQMAIVSREERAHL